MNKWIKNILIIVGVALCVSYAVFANAKSSISNENRICSDVLVTITDYDQKQLISDREIETLLKSKNVHPIGKTMTHIVTKEIEDLLAKHPMIRNVECYKTPEGKIKIVIKQRNPILRIISSDNYYVDDLRQTVPVSSNFTAYVPLATGRISKKLAQGVLYDFANFLSKNPFWNDQIDQIYINENNEVQLIPRVGDHLIVLGNFDRYEQKLEKLRKFYLFGLNETSWNIYSKIDLRFKDQVVCTRKETTK